MKTPIKFIFLKVVHKNKKHNKKTKNKKNPAQLQTILPSYP